MLNSCRSARYNAYSCTCQFVTRLCLNRQRGSFSTHAMTPSEPAPDEPQKRPINLLRGWPSPSVLPAEALRAATNRVLSDPEIYVPGLQYGPDPGYQPLREELSKFLSKEYGTEADAERICISGGASQAMACILQSYTEPVYTKAVWVIAPCYYLACAIFEDAGFKERLNAVPEDSEGIDLDWLERGLKRCEDETDPAEKPVYKNPERRKLYRHVIYVVPSAANPSGKTMTLRRREALVRLARRHDCLVICDDVYDLLQWEVSGTSSTPVPGPSPAKVKILPRLSDIDFALGPSTCDQARPGGKWFGHAISNGSFSKIVGPGIRTGWVEGTRDFAFGLAQTGSTKSGGAPSQLSATIVCEMMKSGQLARHIDEACRPSLQRRHALMIKAVHDQLDRFGVEVLDSNPSTEGSQRTYGGFFVWMTFPKGPTAQSIAKRAKEDENLVVPPGHMFQVTGDEESVQFPNSIRLCFAWEEEQDLTEGVARLGRAVESLWNKGEPVSQGCSRGGNLDTFY